MPEPPHHHFTAYEIRFHGALSPRLATWFDGYELLPVENGDTLLRAQVHDQSELHGILEKIASLNLELISVNPVRDDSKST